MTKTVFVDRTNLQSSITVGVSGAIAVGGSRAITVGVSGAIETV